MRGPMDETRDDPSDVICLSVDVEWACDEVLADLLGELDARGLRATLFVTHAGVDVGAHEGAIHPNFRRDGSVRGSFGDECDGATTGEVYERVVARTLEFCPQAVGVRAHSLHFDSDLLACYARSGLRYDSSYFLPLASGIRPVAREHGIVEVPVWFMDHAELVDPRTDFDLAAFDLDAPGVKVFDFHPNIVYTNAATLADYEAARADYHDPVALRRRRRAGRGARTLFHELLDEIVASGRRTATIADVVDVWSARAPALGGAAANANGSSR